MRSGDWGFTFWLEQQVTNWRTPAVALNFASAPPTKVGDSSQQKYTAKN